MLMFTCEKLLKYPSKQPLGKHLSKPWIFTHLKASSWNPNCVKPYYFKVSRKLKKWNKEFVLHFSNCLLCIFLLNLCIWLRPWKVSSFYNASDYHSCLKSQVTLSQWKQTIKTSCLFICIYFLNFLYVYVNNNIFHNDILLYVRNTYNF